MSELVIDLDSKVILEAHLQCAAHEMPLMDDDEVYFGPSMKEICKNRLVRDKEGWYVPVRQRFESMLSGRAACVQVSHSPEVPAVPCEAYFAPWRRGGKVQCHRHDQTRKARRASSNP